MNPRPYLSSARAVSGPLLAALLGTSVAISGQTIQNPSFEANTFGTFPGYTDGATNGAITGWTATPANRVGLNPAAGTPFANNGAVPAGSNVAFIQAGASGVASLKTTATGLTPGVKYNVSFRINARHHATTFNVAYLQFSTDGGGSPVKAEVTRVSTAIDATPYRYAAFEFTATGATQEITISNLQTVGDHTLLIDDFAIAPSSNAWSFSEWTGDEDSGIDSQYFYTHAYNFGANTGVTINGVPFIGRETGAAGRFQITGLTGTAAFAAGVNLVTGNSGIMAGTFRHGGVPSITLQNLKPNTQYVFSLYGAGWDQPTDADPHRAATFSSSLGGDKYTVNVNHYGRGHGIIVKYTYTTDANGSDVTINYPSTAIASNNVPVVFHTSGFSNREAVASTPAPAWTAAEWNDDATSGVDGGYHYTHAYHFGNATNFNLNGIAFTGIAGANPAAANYTSSIPQVYTNDLNNTVTGVGAAMTRNFVHGGFPEVHTLTGLTPNKQYVFTIYSTGWEAPGGRVNALYGRPGDGVSYLDQDQFGANNGIRLEYRYTADASGSVKIVTSALDGNSPLHVCGISNREADALVGASPAITLQPSGASLGTGADYTLRVGVTGSPQLTYEWKRNGQTISSATGPVLELPTVDSGDSGDYTVTITNGSGSVTSDIAKIVVLDNVPGVAGTGVGLDGGLLAPGDIDPHFTLVTNPDDTASSVVRVGANVPGAWFPNSTVSRWVGPRADTAGAAGAPTDAGEGPGVYVYRTKIDLTNYDLATVVISGSWATDNDGLAIRVNGTAVAGLVSDGAGQYNTLKPFSISSANATFVNGVNNLDFVVRNETSGFTGLRVEGLQAIGALPPNTAPHIAVPPTAAVGPHGGIVTFGVAASGSAPLSYRWYFQDLEIPGENLPTLMVSVDDPSVAGNYKVSVTNTSGTATSANVALTVSNANPVAEFDELTTTQGTSLEIDVLTLLGNDTDADGDPLTITAVSANSSQQGSVALVNGRITYTPPSSGFTGLDGFTYTLSDGVWGGTATGNVLITVNGAGAAAPGPLALTLAGGAVSGTFTGAPGGTYVLQRSVDLSVWIDVDTETVPSSGTGEVNDPAPPAGRAFYRLSYTP